MSDQKPTPKPQESAGSQERPPDAPAYEPPRITKKRSVSRATLFTGGGPDGGGLIGG